MLYMKAAQSKRFISIKAIFSVILLMCFTQSLSAEVIPSSTSKAKAKHSKVKKATEKKISAPINVNVADAKTMQKGLKGVGKKKARSIVSFREKNGSFSKTKDMLRVPGIGRKILEDNKSIIVFK